MDEATARLARTVGARVRQERQARGWTLDQLAEAASASRRSVINVEQGVANPSVGILLKLSDALGIGLPALVAPPEPTPRLAVTRAGEAAALWTGDHGGRGVLVAGTAPPDVLELWDWTVQPGERHSSEAHTEGTREIIHVLSGTLTVEVDGQTVELNAGDALPFPGDVDHAYANLAQQPARFALTVFEPGVGTTPRTGAGRG